MSDTPRTSTAAYNGHAYLLKECEQLERENNALRAALIRIMSLQKLWPNWSSQDLYEEACDISRNVFLQLENARHTEQT